MFDDLLVPNAKECSRKGTLAQRVVEYNALRAMGLTPREELIRVDSTGSVRGVVEVEGLYDFVLEDMSDADKRRFHNGS